MRVEQGKRRTAGRKKKRRLSKFAYFLLLLVLASCGAAAAAVFLKVGSVSVTGNSSYSSAQIIEASGITKKTALLRIDKGKVKEKICAILPYIADAQIGFKLPDGVNIKVTADKPKYLFKYQDQVVLADENLKVLEIRKDAGNYNNLINITGVKVKEIEQGSVVKFQDNWQKDAIANLSAALKEAQLDKITDYKIDNNYQLSVVYDGRISILLGTQTESEKKLKNASAIIKSKIQTTDKGTLDVSTQNKQYTFSPN